MTDDEKPPIDPAMPSPNEVIEALDKITEEAHTLRERITDGIAASMRVGRRSGTDDPPAPKRKKTPSRKRKKAR